MAHEIETMAYFGQLPWHGLGTALDEADLYDWQSASKKAGLDWSVDLVPLLTADTQAKVAHRAVRRTSDGKVLGVVGPRYAPLQNQDAFGWFQPFLDAKEAALHTAGSLRGGSRIWVLAKLNRDPLVIAEGDDGGEVRPPHPRPRRQPRRAGRLHPDPGRLPEHPEHGARLGRLEADPGEAHRETCWRTWTNIREVMDLANAEFEATAEQYRLLARKSINQADLRKYVRRVLKVEEENPSTRSLNIVEEIVRLAETGRGNDLPSIRGTYWTAYNGVSE